MGVLEYNFLFPITGNWDMQACNSLIMHAIRDRLEVETRPTQNTSCNLNPVHLREQNDSSVVGHISPQSSDRFDPMGVCLGLEYGCSQLSLYLFIFKIFKDKKRRRRRNPVYVNSNIQRKRNHIALNPQHTIKAEFTRHV